MKATIHNLCEQLRRTEIGKYSKCIFNYVELLSTDPNAVEKLKSLNFMKDFIVDVYFILKGTNAKVIHIYKNQTLNEIAVDNAVEFEFNNIFKEHIHELDAMYFIDNQSFIIESDDLDLIREINLKLKNFEYTNIQNKHIYVYLKSQLNA